MTAPRISPRVSDDLFESSSMTFGEHLEQLRKALAKSTVWVGIGLIFGLFLADDIVQYIQTPLKAALEQFALKQDLERLSKASGVIVSDTLADKLREKGIISEDVLIDPRDFRIDAITAPASSPASPPTVPEAAAKPHADSAEPASSKPASTNPEPTAPAPAAPDSAAPNSAAPPAAPEAQKTTAPAAAPPGTAAPAPVAPMSLDSTSNSTASVARTQGDSQAADGKPAASRGADPKALYQGVADDQIVERLVPVRIWRKVSTRVETLNIQEGFMIWLKAALIAGIVFGSPGIFWHIWEFVAAGLYPHERKYVYFFLPMSLGLFLAGVSLAFFVIFRFVIEFLLEANASLGTDLSPRLNEYVSFALILPLGFGVAFQLPLVMVFLNRIGLFSVENYLQQWKLAILVIAFLSMILTPGGDIYSMCGMGLPLIFLYFLGIALCKYLPMGRPMGSDGYDPVA